MPEDDYEEDWEDDEDRDVHARILDVDTGDEIHISTIHDDDYERLVDCRIYSPAVAEYCEGLSIPLTELDGFLEVVQDAVWQRERKGRIEHHSRVHLTEDVEIHVSTISDAEHERFVVLRNYNASLKEYGEAVTLPVGLLKDFEEGVTAAWHANGSGDWTGELGPYMSAEGVGG
ncbi:hypothetical protein [Streptomyces sp. NBC_01589]|uniref:hypothetical protein n=1 Tax=unclassified Streptomyces TaxID=2593676 RepID=UPI00386E6DE8